MKPSYRIYFGDKAFVIAERSDEQAEVLKAAHNFMLINKITNDSLAEGIDLINNSNVNAVIAFADNLDEAMQLFTAQFTVVLAGGGLVFNDKGEYLFIFRRGKWDLPKGKLDKGETIDACALREVVEETSVREIILLEHLCNTYHVYIEKGKHILKKSVWYNMTCPSGQALTPQVEEDIIEIKWVAPAYWHTIYDQLFPSIKDVLQASGKMPRP